MNLEPDKQVKIEVTESQCELMKQGDLIYLSGPMIDQKRSAGICITALLSIYPWVMTARYGIKSSHLEWNDGYTVWCPEKLVAFRITTIDSEND